MPLSRSEQAKDVSDDKTGALALNAHEAEAPYDLLSIAQLFEEQDATFKGSIQRSMWQRNLNMSRNRHPSDSKYAAANGAYKNRSRLFRPKTLSAIRKNMAAAAAALFSTEDVVSIKAERDSNPVKNVSAAVLKELLNYRLDRTSAKAGMPWFAIAMGTNRDAQIYGIFCTKQSWEYEVVKETRHELVTRQEFYTDTNQPVLDAEGKPILSEDLEEIEEDFVTKDRPMATLVPPDNVILDTAAPWLNVAQASSVLGLRVPMTIDEAMTMMSNPGKTGEEWLNVTREMLMSSSEQYTSKGVRVARGGNTDRYSNRVAQNNHNTGVVWMVEWFIRIAGVDYHFWSIGTNYYASKVRTTRQAYPEQFGERPVVIGVGAIEPHEVYPLPAVSAWEELQKELNDIVNLRLDTMKQAISPIAKVKQGSMFDWKQLSERGAQGTNIIVKNMDDLEFDRAPDVTASAYQETNYLNADFDDLAGIFSGGSVATNRQINETVGGMRLLSGFANSVTEFDLRVWVETGIEPILRQIVRLEQSYETDEVILAIAGERAASVFEKHGVDAIIDEDLKNDVSVRVNVGIGSADPMQKLQKLQMGLQTLGGMLPLFSKRVAVNPEELIKEIMGAVGYNDGMRFFEIAEFDQSAQDPEAQVRAMEIELERERMELERTLAAEDHEAAFLLQKLKGQQDLLKTLIGEMAELKRAQAQSRWDNAKNSAMLRANDRRALLQLAGRSSSSRAQA